MGNFESIPVISQMISLDKACKGDMEGALRTQEKFARQAIVVSQINSLVHSCMGNNEEAEKIQIEFAENNPVTGLIMSAVYASKGNTQKAKEVAISASNSILETLEIVGFIAKLVSAHIGKPISASMVASLIKAEMKSFHDRLEKLRNMNISDRFQKWFSLMVGMVLKHLAEKNTRNKSLGNN